MAEAEAKEEKPVTKKSSKPAPAPKAESTSSVDVWIERFKMKFPD